MGVCSVCGWVNDAGQRMFDGVAKIGFTRMEGAMARAPSSDKQWLLLLRNHNIEPSSLHPRADAAQKACSQLGHPRKEPETPRLPHAAMHTHR